MLWDPNILPEREVEEFLYRAIKRRWDEVSNASLPEGEMVKDNEQVSLAGKNFPPKMPVLIGILQGNCTCIRRIRGS